MDIMDEELARKIVTSLLGACSTEKHVREFIKKARKIPFSGIGFDIPFISVASELLKDTETNVIACISYPLGGMTTETKIRQVEYSRKRGAGEINYCISYNAAVSGDFKTVEGDVRGAVNAAGNMKVVVVPQLGILTNEKKIKVCRAVLDGGARTIKTNSGVIGPITDIEDVRIVKREFGDELSIEASSGIRTREQALAMFDAGADKIHTSTPFKISDAWQEVNPYKILSES